MPNGRLYCRSPLHPAPEGSRDGPPPPAAHMNLALPLVVVSPVVHVAVDMLGFEPAHGKELSHGALQRVAVIGVALHRPRRQNPAAFGAYGEGYFAAEL